MVFIKTNKIKKLLFILLTIILSYIALNKLYININCKTVEKALNYHAKHNDSYNIKEISNSTLIFSSDDLIIYDIETISKKDFEFEQAYTIKLEKDKNTWNLLNIELKN
ncbi:MAG: hypothetical protein ACRCWM_02870 [Sarcina sp.]